MKGRPLSAALLSAAHNGDIANLRLLLANEHTDVDTQGLGVGFTALMLASENGHLACVRALLDGGADVEAQSTAAAQHNTRIQR